MADQEATRMAKHGQGLLPTIILNSLTRHANRVLVEDGDLQMRGADLAARCMALASRMDQHSGLRPATVAVCVPRDARLVVACVAAAIAGARLVLIDDALPGIRRNHMMRVADPDVLVLGGDAAVEGHQRDVVRLDQDGWFDGASHGQPVGSGYDDGYVFFTSGSTGSPKAVLGAWSSVAHFVTWQCARYGITPHARFAQLTGVSFDVILRDLLTPLVAGATICIPGIGVDAIPWLHDTGITHLNTVPSRAAAWCRGARTVTLPELQWTWFGGETLAGALVRRWRRVAPRCGVTNFYGPTETALAKFAHDIPVGDSVGEGVLPVGYPLPGTGVSLMGAEIVITTRYGTRGYLDAPDEDHARFVIDHDECRYRTGDLGYFDGRGRLYVLGRVDRQIKVDGVRVEPEGVAAVVAEHPDVAAAYVDVRARKDGGHYLACYYTTDDPAGPPDEAELRNWVMARVDRSHVPSVLHRIGTMPLAANGKVDTGKLPQYDECQAVPSSPGDSFTTAVCDAFAEVIGVPVSADTDFGGLGGTSLTAVELAVATSARTHRTVEVVDVFRLRTPRRIAAALLDRDRHEQQPIPPAPALPDYPLAPEQRRYANIYLNGPNRSWNNLVRSFVLPAGTTKQQLDQALAQTVARHDPLRASFHRTSTGDLRQRFAEAFDLGPHTREVSGTDLARLRRDIAGETIDIEHWPLFRARLLVEMDPPQLLWAAHHLIADGESQDLLGQELTELLLAGREGRPHRLAALPARYRDYACWAAGRPVAVHQKYWRTVYREPYRRALLPYNGDTEGGRAYRRPVPASLVSIVDECARRWRVTGFSIIASAFLLAYHQLYDREDLTTAVTVSGRRHPQIRGLLGMFVGISTVRHHRHESGSFRELVDTVQTRIALAMTHQECQFDEVLRIAKADLDTDRFPLTTALITAVDLGAADATDLSAAGHRDLGQDIKWDVGGHVCRRGAELAIDLQYRGELLAPKAVEGLATDIVGFLKRGVAAPDAPLNTMHIKHSRERTRTP